MLYNFQLAALLKTNHSTNGLTPVQIQLHQDLQRDLAHEWCIQYKCFMRFEDLVPFDLGYSLPEHERFYLDHPELPDRIVGENSETVQNLEIFDDRKYKLESIKSIVGFARDEQGEELILFQKFDRSRIIGRQKFIMKLQDRNVYGKTNNQALELDTQLSAIYFPSQAKLLFHSFTTTKRFLTLDGILAETSDKIVKEVLNHNLFGPTNQDQVINNISQNQWIKRKFAMLKQSGILNTLTAQYLIENCQKYDIKIIRNYDNQIIFPEDRENIKRILRFLNEELFQGEITQTLYVTNSKRTYN
jgi:hypothetical protein